MKFNIFLLIICLLAIPLAVSAANNTTNVTNTTVNVTTTLLAPEEFYGNVLYSDNSPVSSGSEIIAKDQRGKTIGNFTMTFNGSYGESYASASRLIVRADNADDMITFYIGTIKSTTPPRKFDSGSIKRSDIVIDISAKSLLSQTSEATPTPTPTQDSIVNQTPETTPTQITSTSPTTSQSSGIIIITNNTNLPTILPTQAQPTITFPITIPTTSTPISTRTQIPTTSGLDDTTTKFLGVLLVGIGICVVGAIITYYILTKKMKRDDEEEIIL
jgi:hypothetical protein